MTDMKLDLKKLTPHLVKLVTKAGELIAKIYEGEIEVIQKKDGSPVTLADQESQTFLKKGLEELTPDIPVISEEDEASWKIKNDIYWLIDPMDGTKGFIFKTGEFCINIALVVNKKPIFGLIHIPLEQLTFYGFGGKAYKVRNNKKEAIHTRSFPKEGLTLLLGGYGKKFKDQEDLFLKTFPLSQIKRLRSAIKFCLIASGVADIYIRFEPCGEWDTAAGQALVEAAGGIMTLIDGKPFTYGKPNLINTPFVVFGQKP